MKKSTKIVLGAVAGFVLIGGCGAAVSGGDSGEKTADPAVVSTEKPGDKKTDDEPAKKESPVKISAENTTFAKSILADGSSYTSVKVTIANDGKSEISVNPLYFTITDTNGTKHTAELGVDENQMETTDLQPGENITGVVTGKGDFQPKYVTYTDGLFSDGLRANVK